jgi:DNA-binding NtrC family response regulator
MDTGGKKILIVDDNQFFLHSFSEAIHKFCGFSGEVKEASAGHAALEEAQSSFFDLCFLDVNLPDMNGIDLMRKINRISPETRVIIMTASYIPEELKKSIEEEACLFVEKPLDLHMIRDFLERELGTSTDADANRIRSRNSNVSDRRLEERSPTDRTFNYSVNNPSVKEHEGRIVDVCSGGQCFLTDTPHEPGHILRFSDGHEEKAGIVRWSVIDEDTNMYRTGIRFL